MSSEIEQARDTLRERYALLSTLYASVDRDAGDVGIWLQIEAHATRAGELMERLEKGEPDVSLPDVLEELRQVEIHLRSMRTGTLH